MAKEKIPKFAGVRDYAAHRVCHMNTIQQYIKQGILKREFVGSSPKLNVAESDKILDALGVEKKKSSSDVPSIQDSKSIKEAYSARIKKLDYEEKKGLLVNKAKTIKMVQEISFSVKERLRTIPQKVSAELAAETDAHVLELRLQKEIDLVLNSLTDIKEGLKL